MAPGDNTDSGIESLSSSNKSLATTGNKEMEPEEIDDEDLDETLSERLWGLTEMFPEGVRNATHNVFCSTTTGIKGLYGLSRVITWCVFSSSVILFAPLILEVELAQIEEMQRNQQKQMLLGPSSAVSGGMGLMPPIQR
ncbi:mitochondrial import receptor subunit TOM22 homolog [Zootermopsis nevadensis]|uniref:Mitochondrial import receptor subunit TOM22 homolog n=1 Tax=Zootermopsis nevadensis TaxID=136037 RepID=A0A067QF18_ZOONE|nr:mitochondrial import receptor subunit TOM22 homolog [Zootermopsis nevadensis]KDQ85825.1 Mitochondrial import receptor subunit TOM22-like protein [Zootermopsis nevadensis]